MTSRSKGLKMPRSKLTVPKLVSLGRVMVPLGAATAGDDLVGSVRHCNNKIKLDVTAMIEDGFSRIFSLSLFASPRFKAWWQMVSNYRALGTVRCMMIMTSRAALLSPTQWPHHRSRLHGDFQYARCLFIAHDGMPRN